MQRGKKPGSPKTGGRIKGVPNKASLEIKDLAREYGPGALLEVAKLAGLVNNGEGKAENESVRATCLNMLFDRGYGRPSQTLGSDPENPLPEMPRVIEHIYVDPKA